jgi:hypothetical protein
MAPRQARRHIQARFDLYPDVPAEAELADLLSELADFGRQRQWIVRTLVRQMRKEQRSRQEPKKTLDSSKNP